MVVNAVHYIREHYLQDKFNIIIGFTHLRFFLMGIKLNKLR